MIFAHTAKERMVKAMTNEEAIVQLEIDATNLVGRLASEPVHDTSFSELWKRKLEAIDIAIYAIKMLDKHEAECERCACNLLAERDAAVEDLKRFSACCQCNANIDGSCCDMFDGTAKNKYFCSNWQWRGPQEAGEGEAE